ncbi:LLM class flavin-dependent oxidoreductase [Alkanindiges illinoisensis]|uniref:Luciferase-like monooxygenase n=1 Tax=Alkanindiges illinoisensis TaxID=197183 RepID=A0A4Y7XB96_9GAMM|nr:LLM class flavin-dependent oxidoreductase [Alkanindiges illinoisensis]TEU25629.1 LLM class flavin-dependent oxidoreductase [Alkanindiges illinoisensis]
MSVLLSCKYSILDLAPIRDDSNAATALKNSLALAQHAEQLGYTRFWVAEHHNMDGIASSATAVLIGYLAANTQTIRVGSGGVMLPNHSPLVVAEQFGTLATLYPNRIDLGLGRAPGADQYTARALRRNHLETAEEFPEDVSMIQALLGEPQPDQRIKAVPGQGTHVPLWLLGSSLFSAQLAAAKGLPYAFASHFAPRFMMDAIKLYRENFQPSKVLDKPYVMLGVPLIAADSDAQAEYLATSLYQRILNLMQGKSIKSQPPTRQMRELNPHEQASLNSFLGMAAIGGPEKIKRRLTDIVQQTKADELIFTGDLYEFTDRLRSFEIVAEIFKGKHQ